MGCTDEPPCIAVIFQDLENAFTGFRHKFVALADGGVEGEPPLMNESVDAYHLLSNVLKTSEEPPVCRLCRHLRAWRPLLGRPDEVGP